MKYIFNKSEKPDTFRQFSLIQDVNQDMILEEIPQIAYEQVESYWKKVYKDRGSVRTASARPTEEPHQEATESQPEQKQQYQAEKPHNEPQEF